MPTVRVTSESELIKTSTVCVAGAVVTVTTVKRDDPFSIYPYETRAVDDVGVTIAEVFHNSCFTTAMQSHKALVHALTQPAQVKRSLGRYGR